MLNFLIKIDFFQTLVGEYLLSSDLVLACGLPRYQRLFSALFKYWCYGCVCIHIDSLVISTLISFN